MKLQVSCTREREREWCGEGGDAYEIRLEDVVNDRSASEK